MAINLLEPENDDIERAVKEYEKDEGFCDKKIYAFCIEGMDEKKICEINDEEDMQIIRLFLVNWGLLGRVVKRRKDWKKDLSKRLKAICSKLEGFRKSKLENGEVFSREEDIKKCYEGINEKFGPTTTSKILHLFCPKFFPMWDGEIRNKISSTSRMLQRGSIGESSTGYFKFMKAIHDFMNNKEYDQILKRLNDEYGWDNKLKIIDEFFMGSIKLNKN